MNVFKRLLLGMGALGLSVGPIWAIEPKGDAGGGASMLVESRLDDHPPVGESGQGCLNDLFCCQASGCRFQAGAGLYLMQARFDNNIAFGVSGTANRSTGAIPPGSPGVRFAQRIEIDHNMVAAPQVWLGFMCEEGVGARVRYWYFREGTSQTFTGEAGTVNNTLLYTAAPAGLSLSSGSSTLVATSKLQLNVIDAEAQYQTAVSKLGILVSGGVRYARIDQEYNAFLARSSDNTLLSDSTFSGAGPTLALELRYPILGSCVNLYGLARYSMVFGDSSQVATIPDQNVTSSDHRHLGIGIADMELGVEFRRLVGRSQLFGQLAVVDQHWSGAGSASRSSLNVLPGGAFTGTGYVGDSDFSFIGLTIRLGIAY